MKDKLKQRLGVLQEFATRRGGSPASLGDLVSDAEISDFMKGSTKEVLEKSS